jgi:hypothetical protein
MLKPIMAEDMAVSCIPKTGNPKYKIKSKASIGIPRINEIYNLAGSLRNLVEDLRARQRKKPINNPAPMLTNDIRKV